MKIIDLSARSTADQPGVVSQIIGRLNQSLATEQARAEQAVIQRLERVLDKRFILLQNLVIGHPSEPPVLLIVGPGGLWLAHASPLRGLFQVYEGQWEAMERGKTYRPAKPDLVERLQSAARLLAQELAALETELPQLETALLFSSAGAHVNAVRPAVRVVLTDAIDRYAAGLLQAPPVLDPARINQVVELLVQARVKSREQVVEAAFADLDGRALGQPGTAEPSRLAQLSRQEPQVIRQIAKKADFNRRQWVWLAVLLVVNIIILVAGILIALLTS
ncbi:MAG: hypothetical protein ACKOC5_07875 [Chloroflexota bacterium]